MFKNMQMYGIFRTTVTIKQSFTGLFLFIFFLPKQKILSLKIIFNRVFGFPRKVFTRCFIASLFFQVSRLEI